MLASLFLDECQNNGICFFTGVPDSLLKGFCDELFVRYGTDGNTHIVAHNEGGAIALCAGHYLATGKPGLCYMQNSGIGNAVNPLASLMDPEVYSIPCLLVIGWRGEPGVKDEPQHIKQGKITISQLEILGIPFRIISEETQEEELKNDFAELLSEMSNGKTAAFIVKKGAFRSECKPHYGNTFLMTRESAIATILAASDPEDIFICTTGKLSREVFELRESRNEGHSHDFLTVGSMGHASMIALQIAIEKPDRKIWCLDGDGASLMHLGAFPLIGRKKAGNFIHVVINNCAHDTVGGMPVCSSSLNITALASASGYAHVFTADSENGLHKALSEADSCNDGPLMIEVRCACGSRSNLGRPTSSPVTNRNELMAFIR